MARNFSDLKESLYIHESKEAKSMIMQNRQSIALELNYVLLSPESSKDAQFERQPLFSSKSKTFGVGQITNTIYNSNLFSAYHKKYMKEEVGNDMYDPSSMHLVFECTLEQLFKVYPKQQISLNGIVDWYMDLLFNWPISNVGDMLWSYPKVYFIVW